MFKRLKTSIISLILVLLLAIPALSSTRALQFEILLNGILHPTTGAPLSAGTVNFYAAGTTTAKTAWTAKDKTGAITSATLGTDGRYQAYGDGEYKLVIKDSGGTTRYTLDNVRVQYSNYSIVSKVGAYTTTADDDVVLANGTFTVTLIASASAVRTITIKNIGTGTITIDGNGSETIDGSTTVSLSTQYEDAILEPDGSNWHRSGGGVAASTTVAGNIEIATDTETATGTATDRAITPEMYRWNLSRPELGLPQPPLQLVICR